MTTHDAILAAVLANPADDLPRLVLADHYEGELGQPERGAWLRWQVTDRREYKFRGRGRFHFGGVVVQDIVLPTPEMVGVVSGGFLERVECELADWCGGECDRCDGADRTANVPNLYPCRRCGATGHTPGIGPRLVREHPVTRVDLSGVVTHSIAPGSSLGAVTRGSAGVLFDVAFQNAVGSRIEGDAEVLADIMSQAALTWAKSTPVPAVPA